MIPKWGAAALTTAVVVGGIGSFVIAPLADTYVSPIVSRELNNAINGSVAYDSLAVDWRGNVILSNLDIYDKNHDLVLHVPQVDVGINFFTLAKEVWQQTGDLRIISFVELDRPTLYLQEYSDASWNISDLVKEKDDAEENFFRGMVELKEAVLHLVTHDYGSVDIEKWTGAFKWNDYPSISGASTFWIDNQQVHLNGHYNLHKSDFSLHLKVAEFTHPAMLKLVESYTDTTLTGGKLTDMDVTLARQHHDLRMDGDVAIESLNGQYDTYTFNDGKVDLHFKRGLAVLENGAIQINEQPVTVKGSIELFSEDNDIDLQFGGQDIVVEKVLPDVDITGKTSAEVSFVGKFHNPHVSGRIYNGQFSYDGYTVTDSTAQFVYESEVLEVMQAEASISDGSIGGSGWYDKRNKAFTANVEGENLPLEIFRMPSDLQGVASGRVHIAGNENRLTDLLADVYGDSLYYHGVAVDSWQTRIVNDDDGYIIPFFSGVIGSGAISGYGTIQNEQLNMSYHASDIPLGAFSPILQHPAEGTVNAAGQIKGSTDNPEVVVTFAAHDGHIRRIPFVTVTGEAVLADSQLIIRNGRWQDEAGGHHIQGSVDFGEARMVDLGITSDHVRIESLIPDSPVKVTGWLDNRLTARGTIESPLLSGQATLMEGSIAGEILTRATVNYRYLQDTMYIEEATMDMYDSLLIGSGSIAGDDIDFRFNSTNINLERFLRNSGYRFDGRASVDGRVTGKITAPLLDARMMANRFTVNDVLITDLQGHISYDNTRVNISDLSFKQQEGQYDLFGGLTLSTKQLYGRIDVREGNLADLIKVADVPLKNMDGRLNGVAAIGGTVDNPSIDVKGSIKELAIASKPVGNGEIDLAFDKHKLSIRTLKLPVENGLLAAKGTIDFNGETDVQIAAKALPVELVTPLVDQTLAVSGKLDFVATVKGDTQDPLAEASITLSEGLYNGVTFDNLFGLISVKEGIINVNQLLLSKDVYKASAYGKIPLIAIYDKAKAPKNGEKNLDLTLKLDDTDMGILPLLISVVKESTGDADGKVSIQGTYDKPIINGDISVKNGSVLFKDNKTPLENIDGRLVFKGTKADLTLKSTMGEGKARAQGTAGWSSGRLDSYEGIIEAEALELDGPYYKGPLSTSLRFRELYGEPLLSGTVTVENATFDVPLGFESSEAAWPLLFDVTINIGEKVRLYNSLLYNVNIDGTVRLGGSTLSPSSQGKVNIRNGTVKYVNTQFKLEPGVVHFNNPQSFLPTIELKGHAKVREYNITMDLRGPVDALQFKLSSEPYLEERQIVSLLTLKGAGHKSSQINAEDVNALITAGLEMTLFSGVESTLQDTFGLDLVSITTGSLDPYEPTNKVNQGYYNIEIGKYLFPNFMVTVAKGVNNDLLVYGARYELGSRFSLNAWANNNNHSYIGGQWRFKF